MIFEFKIAKTSKLRGRMTDEVCTKYNVSYIHMHKGLPKDESLKLLNPPPQEIRAGYYLKVSGDYNNVVTLMEVASGG